VRIALWDFNRPGRSIADGAGGYRNVSRRSFLDCSLPKRCRFHGETYGNHGGARRHQLSANDPAEISGVDDKFPIPGFKVLRQSPQDKVTVIGAGVTLQEALKAADQLKAQGTAVRVIDLYCVKPIDGKELAKEIAATGGRLVTVEDHRGEGGIGEAVLSALAQAGVAPAKSQLLAVREMPHSGEPDELVDAFGISARHIVEAVHRIS
jgi:transketolase